MPKQYLTVNEVARILGVSPLTIRNWDQKGRLQAHRNPMNNYRLYKVEEVEKLLEKIAASKERKNIKHGSAVEKKSENDSVTEIKTDPSEERTVFKKLKIEME